MREEALGRTNYLAHSQSFYVFLGFDCTRVIVRVPHPSLCTCSFMFNIILLLKKEKNYCTSQSITSTQMLRLSPIYINTFLDLIERHNYREVPYIKLAVV